MRLLYEWIFVDAFMNPELDNAPVPPVLVTTPDQVRDILGRSLYDRTRAFRDPRDREALRTLRMDADRAFIGLLMCGAHRHSPEHDQTNNWLNAMENSFGIPSLSRHQISGAVRARLVQEYFPTDMSPIPTASEAVATHIRRRQAYDDFVPPRQQAAALRRQQQPATFVDWDNSLEWIYKKADEPEQRIRLSTAPDQFIWDLTNWLVRGRIDLYRKFAYDPNVAAGYGSARWLRHRPVFRALLREGVRRRFTYPTDVYTFLISNVLRYGEDNTDIREEEPWRQSDQQYQLGVLASVAEVEERAIDRSETARIYGRNRRNIDLAE